jgi:hypothetical protein
MLKILSGFFIGLAFGRLSEKGIIPSGFGLVLTIVTTLAACALIDVVNK